MHFHNYEGTKENLIRASLGFRVGWSSLAKSYVKFRVEAIVLENPGAISLRRFTTHSRRKTGVMRYQRNFETTPRQENCKLKQIEIKLKNWFSNCFFRAQHIREIVQVINVEKSIILSQLFFRKHTQAVRNDLAIDRGRRVKHALISFPDSTLFRRKDQWKLH